MAAIFTSAGRMQVWSPRANADVWMLPFGGYLGPQHANDLISQLQGHLILRVLHETDFSFMATYGDAGR